MALFTPGAIVSEVSGKIAATVYSRNKGGAVIRNRRTPINRRSVAQSTRRQGLASFASAWRGLTDAQRAAWNAAGHFIPLPKQVRSDQAAFRYQFVCAVQSKSRTPWRSCNQHPPRFIRLCKFHHHANRCKHSGAKPGIYADTHANGQQPGSLRHGQPVPRCSSTKQVCFPFYFNDCRRRHFTSRHPHGLPGSIR